MENKLQELTQRLYEEGLVRGREEADALLADAQAKAKQIVDDARAQAELIVSTARTNSDELSRNTLAEIALAGKQAVSTLKSKISDVIIAKSVTGPVSDATLDPAFIKELLVAIAKNWQGSSSDKVLLHAMLPEALKSKLDKDFETKVMSELNNGIEIAYSAGVKSGFKIGPKDGGYYISFTDADFDALLQEHLRSKVSQILYGESK